MDTEYSGSPDKRLLDEFNRELLSKVPHWRQWPDGPTVEGATPLIDITADLLECGKSEYGLKLEETKSLVLGKFESKIYGGSVKVRPAVQIIEQAIATGRLRSGQTVFEATSGNFGLALGLLRGLDVEVIALVSRKLQEGVADELSKQGVKTVNLDIDICPAPGLQINQSLAMAKATAQTVREQLIQHGLDAVPFDKSIVAVEQLLAKQDVIGLAKLLARIYHGFCPEQYDNEQNVLSHETLTGPEIDQQLSAIGGSLKDFIVLCNFGTGGTSTGLSNYIRKKYGTRSVRVVYPLSNQDVAGIRTKEKSTGLRFYLPELYAGQHEVDFQAAKPLLRFFARKGYDIGESSALALYACLQMLNYGIGRNFVVILADGLEKYAKNLDSFTEEIPRHEVTVDEARASSLDYGAVMWTHTAFAPREEGIQLIASALKLDRDKIKIAKASDVQAVISGRPLPESIMRLFPAEKKVLLVCMVGATSLRVAELLGKHGVQALSITGGLMNLPEANAKSPADLIQLAKD